MDTPAPFVWVQLYYEGKEQPDGQVILIKPVPDFVAELAKAVKTELELDAPLNKMYVYSPGTKPPFAKGNSIRPGRNLQDLIAEYKSKQTPLPTSSAHPLIVVAPNKKATPDSGMTLNLQSQPDDDAIQALAHYRDIGKKIRDEASRNNRYNLQGQLKDLNKKLDNVAFAMLDGPSGIGKTQYSFALDEATTRLFVMPGESRVQTIYKNFEAISVSFQRAVVKDQNNAEGLIAYAQLKASALLKSYTAGFLKKVFELKRYPEHVFELHGTTIEPMEVSHFRESYQNYVVVLDEVGSLASDMTLLRFTRNLLRSLGLRVLLMGTHASASTLVGQATHSRGNGNKPELWCRVLTACPPFLGDAEVQVGPIQLKTELLGRPLLVELVQRHRQACGDGISEAQVLDSLLDRVAVDLISRKPAAWKKGRLGQFCMFQPGYYCSSEENVESPTKKPTVAGQPIDAVVSHLIVSHFPYLVHRFQGQSLPVTDRETPSVDLHILDDSLGNENGDVWCPVCEYSAKEMFLFFVLSRWATCFLDGSQRMSTYRAWQRLRDDALTSVATFFNPKNPNANKVSGDSLESVAAVALAVASHIDGVRGCSLERFVLAFITELSTLNTLEFATDNRVDTGTVRNLFGEVFGDEKVPYVGPTNVEIPVEWWGLDGAKFGNTRRPRDKEGIDLLITRCGEETAFMACECKNSVSTSVDGNVLENVMKRVKPEWKVHFMVCNSHTKFHEASVLKAMAHCTDRHLVEATVEGRVVSFKILYSPPKGSTQVSKLSLIVHYGTGTTGIQQEGVGEG